MRGQVPAGYVERSASLGWEAFDSPAVPYRDCRMLAEMLVGYHRNVSAASPAGPPGAHRTRGPLGVQAARAVKGTSLRSSRSARSLPRFTPADNFRSRRRVEQGSTKGGLWSRSHDDDRVEAKAATKAVQGTLTLSSLVDIRARRGKPDVSRGGTDLKQPAQPLSLRSRSRCSAVGRTWQKDPSQ
jgi:hypothetical protein